MKIKMKNRKVVFQTRNLQDKHIVNGEIIYNYIAGSSSLKDFHVDIARCLFPRDVQERDSYINNSHKDKLCTMNF